MQDKRRESRKKKKFDKRKTTFALNRNNTLLAIFNLAQAERVISMKEVHSDEETDNEQVQQVQDDVEDEEVDDEHTKEPTRFVLKRKPFRNLPDYACINKLFESLDIIGEEKKKTKKTKCPRRISYMQDEEKDAQEDGDGDIHEVPREVEIPDALIGMKLLKD